MFALDQAVVTADFVSLSTPVLLFCFTERGKPRRKCNGEDPLIEEKDYGVEKTMIEGKSDMCLDVSINRSILYQPQYFRALGFASFNFSALLLGQNGVEGFKRTFDLIS